MGVSAITGIQQKEFDKDGRNIIVNSVSVQFFTLKMSSYTSLNLTVLPGICRY